MAHFKDSCYEHTHFFLESIKENSETKRQSYLKRTAVIYQEYFCFISDRKDKLVNFHVYGNNDFKMLEFKFNDR